MTILISQLSSGKVITAEFVKLTLTKSLRSAPAEIMTYSSSFRNETIDGTVYSALGGYLTVSAQQRDLESTSYDTTVSLSGVEQQNIYAALSPDYIIKGSKIEIWRGFYDENYVLQSVSKRYTGIVTNYTLQEDFNATDDTYVVNLICSNFKSILEKKISGRFTNPESWSTLGSATDTSMKNIANLSNEKFDFGKTPPA